MADEGWLWLGGTCQIREQVISIGEAYRLDIERRNVGAKHRVGIESEAEIGLPRPVLQIMV